ncbi:alpha/beta hydrolase [Sedimentitalea sp.]|uniref:alpha/beta fold hydrolase n=1 Tax=Sedimentitalea sp. TaxID=2048915 RepID=UPI00329A21D0
MRSLQLREWNTVIRWCELPGEGVPIVCLPGLSFAAVPNFLPLMTHPQFGGRRIVMVDYVGSGFSGHSECFGFSLGEHTSAIAAVLDAACSEPVHLLGYSMGGSVAISVALSRPDLVSRLVVCEGNLTPGGGEASRRIAASEQDTFVATDYPERMNSLAKAATEGATFPDFLWAARSGADPRGVHGNARALVDLVDDFEERFLALPLERHYVYGEQGFPGNTGKVMPDLPDPDLLSANGVHIHVVPGVGHSMMIDDPATTADVLGPLL